MENPKFVLKKSEDKQYYFTLQAENGQVLVTSETYTQKHNCYNGIAATLVAVCNIDIKEADRLGQTRMADAELIEMVKANYKIDDQTNE